MYRDCVSTYMCATHDPKSDSPLFKTTVLHSAQWVTLQQWCDRDQRKGKQSHQKRQGDGWTNLQSMGDAGGQQRLTHSRGMQRQGSVTVLAAKQKLHSSHSCSVQNCSSANTQLSNTATPFHTRPHNALHSPKYIHYSLLIKRFPLSDHNICPQQPR